MSLSLARGLTGTRGDSRGLAVTQRSLARGLIGIHGDERGYNEPRHFDRALIYINVSPLKS